MNQAARSAASAMPTLSSTTLSTLSSKIEKPAYDVAKIGTGILHISLGAFHRAHQAVYTDDVLAKQGGDWGICGVGAMASDKTLIEPIQGARLFVQCHDARCQGLGCARYRCNA